jgi:TP901 family phage tail tape measure protein
MQNLFQLAILFKTIDQATKPIREIQKSMQSLQQTVEKTQSKFEAFKDKLKSFESKVMSMEGLASGAVWGGAFKKVMSSYSDMEDAALFLKATSMEAGGAVSKHFSEIDKEAKKLGNELPGTTADFYNLAASMHQLGVTDKTLASGGLRAAAYLGSTLKIPYQEAGESVAKFKNALGIADKDLISFMDTIQRLGHLGVTTTEMKYAFSEMAGTLKILNWQGLQSAKDLSPLVGMFIQMGETGQTVGHNLRNIFSAFLNPKKLQEFTSSLSQFGIQLDIYDAKTGNLKGPVQLIAEFDKITQAYKKGIISQTQLFDIASKLTGPGGKDLDMFLTILKGGADSYNKMAKAMADQADLQKRVNVITGSLRNTWEAFTGTMENLFAVIGSTMAPALKNIVNLLNDISGIVGEFLEKHKTLAKIIGWSVGTLALFTVSIVALATVFTAILFPIKMFISTIGFFSPVLKGGAVAFRILSSAVGFLGPALKTVAVAFRVFSSALFTTPVGWVILGITALVVAGYLIWRNWGKISKALVSIWNWVKGALSSVWGWIKNSWEKVVNVFLYISPITAPIMALEKLVKFVFGINLFNAGKKIIESLWKGIQSLANKPYEAVKGIVQKIRNLLPFSPAKEGPLRDLNRIKIIETIASSLNPSPLVSSMTQALALAKSSLQPIIQPIRQVLEPIKNIVQPIIQPVKQMLEPVKAFTQPLIQPVKQVLEPIKAITQPIIEAPKLITPPALAAASVSSGAQITNHFTNHFVINGSLADKEKEAISSDMQKIIEKAISKINWDKTRRMY